MNFEGLTPELLLSLTPPTEFSTLQLKREPPLEEPRVQTQGQVYNVSILRIEKFSWQNLVEKVTAKEMD